MIAWSLEPWSLFRGKTKLLCVFFLLYFTKWFSVFRRLYFESSLSLSLSLSLSKSGRLRKKKSGRLGKKEGKQILVKSSQLTLAGWSSPMALEANCLALSASSHHPRARALWKSARPFSVWVFTPATKGGNKLRYLRSLRGLDKLYAVQHGGTLCWSHSEALRKQLIVL